MHYEKSSIKKKYSGEIGLSKSNAQCYSASYMTSTIAIIYLH